MSKRTILGIASALIVVLGWWSCHRGGSSNPAQLSGEKDGKGHNAAGAGGAAVPIVAGKAEQKDMSVYLDGLGTVRAERGSVSTHLVFSAICVRGDVVITSALPNEVAQITSRALPEIPTAAHFNNSLVFLSLTDGRNDDCTYDC
jgi:hypothetical protein